MSSAFRISKQRVLPSLLSATPNRITEVTLNGLIDKKGRNNSSYFSSCLDFTKALQMLNNDNYLLEAIDADRMPDETDHQIMSYLTTCYESAQTFLMSDRICDREQFMVDIDDFARTKGSMGLLTGGPSVGTEKPFIVLYVNGRSSSTSLLADLMAEIYSAIPKMDKLKEFFLSRGGLLSATSAIVEALKDVVPGYSTEVLQSCLRIAELMLPTNDSKENIIKARELLSKLSEKMTIAIIIDEANAYFRKTSDLSADLLQMFILLTKEEKLVNVLLSTSEFSFPY
eukprot:gene31776-41242_t